MCCSLHIDLLSRFSFSLATGCPAKWWSKFTQKIWCTFDALHIPLDQQSWSDELDILLMLAWRQAKPPFEAIDHGDESSINRLACAYTPFVCSATMLWHIPPAMVGLGWQDEVWQVQASWHWGSAWGREGRYAAW